MFDVLSRGFEKAKSSLLGKTVLTPENISEALENIRVSLLEADVNYDVVKKFLASVQEEAVGQLVKLRASSSSKKMKVSTSDHFVRICQKELEKLMGDEDSSLNFSSKITKFMMVGLQGSGKTTSAAKLARYLIEKYQKKPLLVAADIYRPAAIEQLKVLGQRIDVPVYSEDSKNATSICQNAYRYAAENGRDTIIIDTAGRLTIDTALMQELADIKQALSPENILLVCDAMMGQDAVTTSTAFNDELDLTGVIITKLDGDARGGAALSIKSVTGKSIKFLGMGEDLTKLEEFRPQGIASRILGMGDVVGLMQDFEKVVDEDSEEKATKMLQGSFNFLDFYEQLEMMSRMGSMKDMIAKLPMVNSTMLDQIDESILDKYKVVINSMTKKEKLNPALLNKSRIERIAKGSGVGLKTVEEFINKFFMMKKMMSSFGKGLLGKIPGLRNMAGLSRLAKMGPSGISSLFSGAMGGGGTGSTSMYTKKKVDREKAKKLKKQAKKSKKKNRK